MEDEIFTSQLSHSTMNATSFSARAILDHLGSYKIMLNVRSPIINYVKFWLSILQSW